MNVSEILNQLKSIPGETEVVINGEQIKGVKIMKAKLYKTMSDDIYMLDTDGDRHVVTFSHDDDNTYWC